jgi:hypothetical protein
MNSILIIGGAIAVVRISQKINKERVGIDFEILDFLMWPEGSSRPPEEVLGHMFLSAPLELIIITRGRNTCIPAGKKLAFYGGRPPNPQSSLRSRYSYGP